jgi:hypothetical protein
VQGEPNLQYGAGTVSNFNHNSLPCAVSPKRSPRLASLSALSDQCFEIGRCATPLKHQQVQRRRFSTCENGQAGVCLSAMVSLVIEQMQQDIRQYLRLWHSSRCSVTMQTGQRRFVILVNNRN